jgi:peroxiredoxin
MKNYLLLMMLCLSASLVSAQEKMMTREDMFPKSAKYYIKGGAEISYDKIDSVMQSWGGRFAMQHVTEGNQEIIYLAKPDADMAKRQQEGMAKLNAMTGKVAPPLELTGIDGKKYAIQDLKGKVVVLNFWFAACVPCKEEMPELNKLKEKYKGKDIIFLAIGLDNAGQIKAFLKTNTFNYTILSDGRKTADAYQVSAFPTSMVIDRSGVISYSHLGGDNIIESLSKEIDRQL